MVPQPPIHKWVHFQVPIHTKKSHLKTEKSMCNYLIRNSPFFLFSTFRQNLCCTPVEFLKTLIMLLEEKHSSVLCQTSTLLLWLNNEIMMDVNLTV